MKFIISYSMNKGGFGRACEHIENEKREKAEIKRELQATYPDHKITNIKVKQLRQKSINKAEKIEFRITSGEGEQGTIEHHYLTERGAKRTLTKERCNGDRWAFAEFRIGDAWVPFDY